MFIKRKSLKTTFILVFIKFLIINYNTVNFSLSYKIIVLLLTFLISLFVINSIFNDNKPKYIKLVLGLFYVTFFLLNELIFLDPIMVVYRKWETSAIHVQKILSLSYFLFIISLISIHFGMNLKLKKIKLFSSKIILSSKDIVYLAVSFLLIGIIGNIILIGGLQNYISSFGNVFTYSDLYLERAESFKTNLVLSLIMRSFFLPGCLLIYYLYEGSRSKNILLIMSLVIFLAIFNGVTGQRSDVLTPVIFIALKHFYDNPTFKLKHVLSVFLFFSFTVLLAFYRDYTQLGLDIQISNFFVIFIPLIIHAINSYVSNFNGVFSLLEYYTNEGLFKIDTIINQFSGILGGASPISSQQYYWLDLTGQTGSNIRLGLFLEFFMNYSYYGILLMIIVGIIIRSIGSLPNHYKNSVVDKTLSAFFIYMLVFLVQSNFNYLPRQMFYLSWPYILLMFIYVKKKNYSYSNN